MLSIVDAIDAGPEPGTDELLDRVAAAALAQFAEFGIRRSTVDDVARRAGVSRVTVFRRFENKKRLVEVVVAREIRRGVAELARSWEDGESLEQRMLDAFSFTVRVVSGHPLFDRLLRSEPEMLLPLLTVDGGPALALYRSLIAELLRAEIAAGRAATADPDRVAEVVARLAISLVLTRDGTLSLDDPDSMAALVKHVLLPALQPPTT
jgi:TetR/AcrR family transcriptional regulator, repressor for uid operon